MKVTKEKLCFYLRYALIALMVLTVIFIFVQSSLPPEVSSAESEAVGGFITSLIPEDTRLFDFVTEYMRKIAHFTEYGLLGIEIAFYIAYFVKDKKKYLRLSPTVPFFVGFVDETLQCFSKRGPMIEDVWIDIGGFITFSLLAWGVIILINKAVLAIQEKKMKEVCSDKESNSEYGKDM